MKTVILNPLSSLTSIFLYLFRSSDSYARAYVGQPLRSQKDVAHLQQLKHNECLLPYMQFF